MNTWLGNRRDGNNACNAAPAAPLNTHSMTQGAFKRRASASAFAADASLSLRPWITRTGKPAVKTAGQQAGIESGQQLFTLAMDAASQSGKRNSGCRMQMSAFASGALSALRSQRVCAATQPQHRAQHAHCQTLLSHSLHHAPAPPPTLHNGPRVHVAELMRPAGVQLALEAMRRLRGRTIHRCHVLPSQQLLALR